MTRQLSVYCVYSTCSLGKRVDRVAGLNVHPSSRLLYTLGENVYRLHYYFVPFFVFRTTKTHVIVHLYPKFPLERADGTSGQQADDAVEQEETGSGGGQSQRESALGRRLRGAQEVRT
jgi:hypothetical protein